MLRLRFWSRSGRFRFRWSNVDKRSAVKHDVAAAKGKWRTGGKSRHSKRIKTGVDLRSEGGVGGKRSERSWDVGVQCSKQAVCGQTPELSIRAGKDASEVMGGLSCLKDELFFCREIGFGLG